MTQITQKDDSLKDYMQIKLLSKAINILELWDGNAYKESVGASIFYVWEQKFWEHSMAEE